MRNTIFFALLLALIFNGCEKTVVAYPGNTQDLTAVAPKGTIVWDEENVPSDAEGNRMLEENSPVGLTIGALVATDDNPDDEFTFAISSQDMDGTSVNYFVLTTDSSGTDLELSNGNINYETLSGSKMVKVQILVEDDSPAKKTGTFDFEISIVNMNETPIFTNLNQIIRYADEYIDYVSPRIEWTDTDEGDNPILTYSNLPGWLNIDAEGNIGSITNNPPQSSDVGNHEFLVTITDPGNISVQEEINIEVRENLAPLFINTSSIPQTITVGCWSVNQELIDLSWNDPNNGTQNFAGNDIVSFTVEENVEWMNWDDDGTLFCYTAPENSNEGTSLVTLRLEDNRPNAQKTTEYQFDLTVVANDAPDFSNLGSFPSQMDSGDTLSFNVDWVDPNEDQTVFNLAVTIGSNTYSTTQLSWISIDQTGLVTVIPGLNNTGEKTFTFSVSDECFTTQEQKSFTIQ